MKKLFEELDMINEQHREPTMAEHGYAMYVLAGAIGRLKDKGMTDAVYALQQYSREQKGPNG